MGRRSSDLARCAHIAEGLRPARRDPGG
jgi:hypothetical protein